MSSKLNPQSVFRCMFEMRAFAHVKWQLGFTDLQKCISQM